MEALEYMFDWNFIRWIMSPEELPLVQSPNLMGLANPWGVTECLKASFEFGKSV